MPKFNTGSSSGLEQHVLKASTYGFSATRIEDLDASEYTLVTICQDDSSSVAGFKNEMEKTIKAIIEACKKSPRADNLMVRLCTFNTQFQEVHGFKRLQQIKPSDYDGILGGGGMTALYDAATNAVMASNAYGKKLSDNDFAVNAITFFVTDGEDNSSRVTPHQVRDALQAAMKEEALESIVSILVGVNSTNDLDQYLDMFKNEAGITQYVGIGDATAGKLAKLAEFVSKSISAQSQALGTGGPSQSLSF
jgi:uncharacterized protein YegL